METGEGIECAARKSGQALPSWVCIRAMKEAGKDKSGI